MAAPSCAPNRNTGSRIDEQLKEATRYAHAHHRWFRFEPEKNTVHLTSLYKWYGGDFKEVAGSVENFAARYAPELKSALDAGKKPSVKFLDYDWSLNSVAKKEKGRRLFQGCQYDDTRDRSGGASSEYPRQGGLNKSGWLFAEPTTATRYVTIRSLPGV